MIERLKVQVERLEDWDLPFQSLRTKTGRDAGIFREPRRRQITALLREIATRNALLTRMRSWEEEGYITCALSSAPVGAQERVSVTR